MTTVRMKAEVTSIKMLNDQTYDGAGNWNLVFALYSGDFGESFRKQTETVAINSGDFWPTDKLPSPIVECVSRLSLDNPKVLTVQGWRDGDDPHGGGIISQDDYFSQRRPTVYRPTVSSNSWPTGDFTISDPYHSEFEVTFRVSFIFTLPGTCSEFGATNPPTDTTDSLPGLDLGVGDGSTNPPVSKDFPQRFSNMLNLTSNMTLMR
jgi:hypothetical protein